MADNTRLPPLTQKDIPEQPIDETVSWGSDVAAQMLRQLEIPYVALNPGASYRGLHDSLVNHLGNHTPEMLMCLHEEHAVAIAQGYAKATGKPMGVVLHANVGLMHGTMAIFNAWGDRQPMVILGATGPVDAAIRRPWIDWLHTSQDQGSLVRNFVKYDDQPGSIEAIPESMLRAWQQTTTKPSGPVYVCLDAAIQEKKIEEPIQFPNPARFKASAPSRAAAADISEAASLLKNARNPVILYGRCDRTQEGWDNRLELAERLGAKMLSDLKAGAMVPTNHELHASVPFTGLNPGGKAALRDADVILSIGWIDLGGVLRQAFGASEVTAKVIHAGVDAQLHNGWGKETCGLPPVDINLMADPDQVVTDLLAEVPANSKKTYKLLPPSDDRPTNDSPMNIRHVAFALRDAVGEEKTSFAALARSWPVDVFPHTHPLAYLGKDGGGGIGSGPGLTIGAALAQKHTDLFSLAVLGDGDTSMSINALWTAAKYEIPTLIVIANNRSYFNDELHQEGVAKIRNRNPKNRWVGQQVDNPAPDLATLAEGQGVKGIGPITDPNALAAAIAEGVAEVRAGRPCLIDVHIDPEFGRHVRESGADRSMAKEVK